MRKRNKAAVVGIALASAIAFFFLAPVFESGDLSAVDKGPRHFYNSLGCLTIGIGAMYGQNMFGFQLGCSIAIKWYSQF